MLHTGQPTGSSARRPRAREQAQTGNPAPGTVRVLYVAGSGRSGSTLFDSILGQVDGFFSAGELRYLWQRGVIENRLCGCGVPFADCAVWGRVMRQALRSHGDVDPRRLVAAQRRQTRALRVPHLLTRAWLGRRSTTYDGAEVLTDVYRSIGDCTNARVLVDSSKLPPYGQLLSGLDGVELVVLHVVRDPRATAFSWMRNRALPDFGDDRMMQRQRPWKSAALWLLWNVVAELLWRRRLDGRYLRIRYEDFVRAPEETIARITALVGVETARLPFRAPGVVEIAATHSVAGNPSRHRTGPVRLEPDVEWAGAMRRRDVVLVTLMTWPLLMRYRYPLRRRSAVQR